MHAAYILVGCTAAGKSAVAHRIARQMDYDILSADSMQVYRGMDIGTDKPTRAQRGEVGYYGIDLVSPGEGFSAGAWYRAAAGVLRAACERGRSVIVAGGTGLYVNCLLYGLTPRPPADPAARAHAEEIFRRGGVPALLRALRRIDPRAEIAPGDAQNPRRLVRAMEMAAAGIRPESWARDAPRIPGLRRPPQELSARIESRARAMFAGGLLDEVRRLAADRAAPAFTAAQAIGYAEALACLRGDCTPEDAVAKVIVRTRRLAKRQSTWFRRQLPVEWLDVHEGMPLDEQAALVLDCWRRNGPAPVRLPDD